MNHEQVTRDIEELESLRTQVRSWRTAAALAVIIIVVASVMIVVNSVQNLALAGPTRDTFIQEFQRGFAEDVMPQVRLAGTDALQELTPVVREEIEKLNQHGPRVAAAVEKELTALQASLPQRAETAIESTIGAMLRQREGRIRKMYPGLTDENVAVLMDNLTGESRNRVVKVMDDLFKPQQDTLDRILAHLQRIQELEAANLKDEPPTWDMAILFFDVIKEDLRGLRAEDFPHPTDPATP